MYHKIGILSTGTYFQNQQPEWVFILEGCLFSWGANKTHVVFWQRAVVWEWLVVTYLSVYRGSFSVDFCQCLYLFYKQRYRQQLLPTPVCQRKVVGTNESGRANPWVCFIKRPCLQFWFVSRVDGFLIIKGRHWRILATMFKTAESAYSHPFATNAQ